MGGIKKTRGKDKKKRKSRKAAPGGKPEKVVAITDAEDGKPGLLRGIIQTVSEKLKREDDETWTLGVGPRVTSQMLGRHAFKVGSAVEIDLKKL